MDIEGAEDAAILGATETIRRFQPKLTIFAYHKPDDMMTLPTRILDIVPEYRFYHEHMPIVDVLMFNSPKVSSALLNAYLPNTRKWKTEFKIC